MPHRLPILAAAVLSALPACSRGDEAAGPNVLLVTLDTARADRLGCYGGAAATPYIDALADEGAIFARAVSTAGLTPMSHASILTGLNNYRHGLRVFFSTEASFTLDPSVATLPELLGRRGWRTAAFVSAYPASAAYGLDRGFEQFDSGIDIDQLDLSHQQAHSALWDESGRSHTQRRGDFTVSAALDWLDGVGSEPWLMWVHLFDVHDFSLVPPAEWSARLGIQYDPSVKNNDLAWRERMYDAELTFADEQVGRLLERIRARGEWEETIVVITADHGQGLTEGAQNHGWFKHRLLYEWSLHVPLIVRIPGEREGLSVEPLVRTIDVLPTLLEAIDLAGPDVEGESLLVLLRGGVEDDRVGYADALNVYDAHAPKKMRPEYLDNLYCVTDSRWKLIWHERAPLNVELYDLQADPDELHNVAPDHPAEVERRKHFLDERGAMDVRPPDAESAIPDPDALEHLGYMGAEEELEDGEAGEDAGALSHGR